jgi:diguanylate cyclase (GGDEF)-like protein
MDADRPIVRVAAALTAAATGQAGAVVSRIGGDEFCVLLPGGDAAAARAVADEAVRRLAGGEALPVGISCGVAARADGVDRPAALLRAADFAQYRAKHAGPGVAVEAADPAAPDGLPGLDGGRAYRGRPAT